jgi:hypothetical protein
MRKVWSTEERSIIREFYPILSAKDLLDKLPGRTMPNIKDAAKRLGVKCLSGRRARTSRAHILDDLDNDIVCYWWGFIMADGCLTKRQLILSIHDNDSRHLEKFSDLIKTKIKRVTRINSWHKVPYTMVRATLNHKYYITKWLSDFSISGAKTYNPPNLSLFYTNSRLLPFLVGLIDGDGHIAPEGNIRIKTHKSWYNLFLEIQAFLFLYYEILSNVYMTKSNFVIISIPKASARKLSLMSGNLPRLERKWLAFAD